MLIFTFTLGIAGLIFVGSRAVTKPELIPAVSTVPIESASDLADRLTNAGVKFELDQGGQSIMVDRNDLAKADLAKFDAGTDKPKALVDLVDQGGLRRQLGVG